MDWEATLAALLGFVGKPVIVGVAPRNKSWGGEILTVPGVLTRADEHSPRREEFEVTIDHGDAPLYGDPLLYLDRSEFEDAELSESGTLRIYLRDAEVEIAPHESLGGTHAGP
jgi:hypothetical protein